MPPLESARLKVVEKLISSNTPADDPQIKADVQQVVDEMTKVLGADHFVAKDRLTLQRFCIARKLDTEAIKVMIDAHSAWRAANLPVKITPAIVAELKKGKVEAYGKDVNGRPVIMVRSGKFDPKERDLEVAMAAVFHLVEQISAQYPPDTSFVVFYDRSDFSLRKNWDFDFIKGIISCLSDNYPERLGAVYLHPTSLVLSSLWALIKPFMEPRTRAKVRFISSDKELLTLIPAEYVPTSSGGTSQHVFDPSMYDSLLAGAAPDAAAVPVS